MLSLFGLGLGLGLGLGCSESMGGPDSPIAPATDAATDSPHLGTALPDSGSPLEDAGRATDAAPDALETDANADAGAASDGQSLPDEASPPDAPAADACSAYDWSTDDTHCGTCQRWVGCNPRLGAHCSLGMCCPAGKSTCGVACVDLQADGMNCGACGQGCASGSCVGGKCQ